MSPPPPGPVGLITRLYRLCLTKRRLSTSKFYPSYLIYQFCTSKNIHLFAVRDCIKRTRFARWGAPPPRAPVCGLRPQMGRFWGGLPYPRSASLGVISRTVVKGTLTKPLMSAAMANAGKPNELNLSDCARHRMWIQTQPTVK